MGFIQGLILCSIILINGGSCTKNLKLIQMIFRHGDRAPPISSELYYPLDPYNNETWYPEGCGGLTNGGKIRAYKLGEYVRERYGKWLGEVYLKDQVQFWGSNQHRIMMSTQLLAAGLFRPTEIQRFHPDLDWQPIPVQMLFENNLLLNGKFYCSNYLPMMYELMETDKILVAKVEEMKEFFDFLTLHAGVKVRYNEGLQIYHKLYSQMVENVTLPDWTREIFSEGKLYEVAAFAYFIHSWNGTMKHVTGSPWIRELLNNVDNHLMSSSGGELKAIFYGAHEHNVAGILNTLGIYEPHVPFYSSAVIFEFSEIGDELFVKVLYRNKDDLKEMLIPGCPSLDCPLSIFREIFSDLFNNDPEDSCIRN